MSRLAFARVVQCLYLFICVALLSLAHGDASDIAKNALLAVGSLLTAMMLVALKCRRCGYSLYRTPNYRINLLVPAARTCAHCGTPRS